MTATYIWDAFMTLDGYGSYNERGDRGGYWGKQGPELLEHRLGLYSSEHRMVFGATTMRINIDMLGPNTDGAGRPDPWVARMQQMPGSLSLNRSLLAAGLVDQLQVTIFPVISGQTGADPLFAGAADLDLELLDRRTLDGNVTELTYHPTLHRG